MKTTLKTILGITMTLFIANCSRHPLGPIESKPASRDSIVVHPFDSIVCPWDTIVVAPVDSLMYSPVDSVFILPPDSL